MTAAITTCGAVTMLWFCTIQIFVKVGLIIAASTVLGIITALAPAGALLACCGPRSMKRTCKGQIVVKTHKSQMCTLSACNKLTLTTLLSVRSHTITKCNEMKRNETLPLSATPVHAS